MAHASPRARWLAGEGELLIRQERQPVAGECYVVRVMRGREAQSVEPVGVVVAAGVEGGPTSELGLLGKDGKELAAHVARYAQSDRMAAPGSGVARSGQPRGRTSSTTLGRAAQSAEAMLACARASCATRAAAASGSVSPTAGGTFCASVITSR